MIDLFGHGPRRLPSVDTQYFSEGPDRKRGPSKCRGSVGDCYGGTPNPHDHSCCCDPCRHKFIKVCESGNCCRCVPKAICAVFTPDVEEGGCKARTWRAEATVVGNRAVYTFVTQAGDITLSVGRDNVGYDVCTWRLHAPSLSVDESVAIDHSGDVHCQSPPDFEIENINIPWTPVDADPEDCFGTLRFTESTEAKVPFRYRWKDQDSHVEGLECGYCSRMCAVLCVKRGNTYESEYTRTDFVRIPSQNHWAAVDGSGEFITLHEEYGDCFFKLENFTPSTFVGDLIEITECAEGMDLTVVNEDGDYVRISCNPCSCWRYFCGTCRCVCRSLCVVGMIDGELASFALQWDKDTLRWGDDDFSVQLSRKANGECQVYVTGYDDPIDVPDACGSDLAFQISESAEDQLESGLTNYLYFRCAGCASDCSSGTCLDICDDVPSVLYAEVNPRAWNEMLGCNPLELCFEPITFPLVQVFVGTLENPAGEWRWVGCGIISCKNCLSSVYRNQLICVDIGCDGVGTFFASSSGHPFSITIPCHSGDVVDEEVGPFDSSPGADCCDEAGYLLRITE